jgi:hypothetical protein
LWRFVAPLYAQIIVKLIQVLFELGTEQFVYYPSVFHHIIAVRHGGREAEVLFDQQNRKALRFQGSDGVADLLDDDRRKTFGRLVEQKQPRARA